MVVSVMEIVQTAGGIVVDGRDSWRLSIVETVDVCQRSRQVVVVIDSRDSWRSSFGIQAGGEICESV